MEINISLLIGRIHVYYCDKFNKIFGFTKLKEHSEDCKKEIFTVKLNKRKLKDKLIRTGIENNFRINEEEFERVSKKAKEFGVEMVKKQALSKCLYRKKKSKKMLSLTITNNP